MAEEPRLKADDEDVPPQKFDEKVEEAEVVKPEFFVSAAALAVRHDKYHEPIIEGLLRRRELMTLVSTSKRGKTWGVMDLGINLAVGRPWFGMPTKKCRTLIVDSELHGPSIGMRLKQVVAARGIDWAEIMDNLVYVPLREIGLMDIVQVTRQIVASGQKFDAIILDPIYRLYPQGMNENDNHLMASLYSTIDGLAKVQDAGIVLVHHPTKGNQSGKDIIEVGAGAGSMTRATDVHLVFRQHTDPDAVTMEAVARTFPQPEKRCLRWTYPIWVDAPDLDPEDLYVPAKRNGRAAKPEPQKAQNAELTPAQLADKFLDQTNRSAKQIYQIVNQAGIEIGEKSIRDMLNRAVISGFATEVVGPRSSKFYVRGGGLFNSPSESSEDSAGALDGG